MRLLVTRPAEEAGPLAAALRARGHEPVLSPVMEIIPAPGAVPDLSGVQAVLATSRNGVRALARATSRRDLTLLAVGEATAEAARQAGFAEVLSADGDVAALARLCVRKLRPEDGPLLHVAGNAVAGDLAGLLGAKGFALRRAVLYEARPLPALPEAARRGLARRELAGALFFSPRTARLFGALVAAAGLESALEGLTAYCLSPAVAEAARGLPFRHIAVAAAPAEAALLALIPLEPGGSAS